PGHGVAAGKHVLLHAEGRYVETVDHILRSHDQLHVAADRDVQFVDLTLAFGVFELPHPLFRDDVNLGRIAGWSTSAEKDYRSPEKDGHENEKRNDRPRQLQRNRTFNLHGWNSAPVAVT